MLKATWSPRKLGVNVLHWEPLRNSLETGVCGIQNIPSEASLFRVNLPLFATPAKLEARFCTKCCTTAAFEKNLIQKPSFSQRSQLALACLLAPSGWESLPPNMKDSLNGPNVCLISGMGLFALDIVEGSQFLLNDVSAMLVIGYTLDILWI